MSSSNFLMLLKKLNGPFQLEIQFYYQMMKWKKNFPN